MSAAADSQRPRAIRRRQLGEITSRLDQAMANGRIPALLIVIVTGLLLYAFIFTDDFRVETVVVEGLKYGDGAAVIQSSDLLDVSAFRARPDAAVAEIAALPYVKSVSVDMRFPGRATIKIEERKPILNVEQDGITSLVSADGYTISSSFVEGLPLLHVDNRGAASEEILSPAVVSAARAVADVYGPDTALIWNPEIGLVMELAQDKMVVFGAPDGIDAKLGVLAAIEAQIDSDWSQLDIRVPTRPSYR
jgi:POTRA domain, FtsQ-type